MDEVQIRLLISGQNDHLIGLNFQWTFLIPAALRYSRAPRLIFTIFALFSFISYMRHLKFDKNLHTQRSLVAIGVLSIFAVNPIFNFLLPLRWAAFWGSLTTSVFLGFFRDFLLSELEILRTQHPAPSLVFLVIVHTFFLVYILVDCDSDLVRRTQLLHGQVLANSGFWMAVFDRVYLVVSAVWFAVAAIGNRGRNLSRLLLLGAVLLGTGWATWYCRVKWSSAQKDGSFTKELLFEAGHFSFAAILMFMMQTSGEIPFAAIKPEDVAFELELERGSDGQFREEEDDP
jgi:hypothetical protein